MRGFLLPDCVRLALDRLEAAGYSAYLVGGCVRDTLMGRRPHDFDLCTSATPEQVKAALPGERFLDTGLRHGTVTLLPADGGPIEITTYRVEGGYSDSRHPDGVRFVQDIRFDLSRRDFTVNAMAYSPARGLVDPFGGQRDLKKDLLRCVGVPAKRLDEDALRILRGLRLAAQTGFDIERDTAEAMRRKSHTLLHLTPERVFSELNRLLLARYVGRVLRQAYDVLSVVLPELEPMVGFDQHNYHHLYDIFEHTVRVVESVPPTPALRWAALFHDSGKPSTFTLDEGGTGHFYGHPKASEALAAERLRELCAPGELLHSVPFLVRQHDVPFGEEERQVRRRLSNWGELRCRELLMLKKADCVGQGTHPDYLRWYQVTERQMNRILSAQQPLTVRDLCLNGYDLQFLGLSDAEIGRMQRWLLALVLEDPALNQVGTLRDLIIERMEEAEA